ncbi:alpha/beta fold hydrolase [Cellulomonas sp. P5_C6]
MQTVLVPGLACSARLFDSLVPALWAHGAVTVADTRRDDSIAGMAQRLLDSAPDHFALVGASMGGYVALEVVRRAPERVVALGLVSTSARPDSAEETAGRRKQAAATRTGRYRAVVDAAFPVLVDPAHRDDSELLAVWRRLADEVGPDAFVRQLQACVDRVDSRPLLPTLTCPTTVVHGLGDQLMPVETARETAAAIPGANLVLVERAGHMVLQEKPGDVAAALGALLTRGRLVAHR